MPTYGSGSSFSTSSSLGVARLPLWRFAITTLDGEVLTFLDHLAADRVVTPKLGEPLEVSFTVPSDSPEVRIPHTDGFPFVAEGVRQVICMRRESDTPPYYTVRGAALILQVGDAATSGDARTTVTAWDPWMYLFSRPVLQSVRAKTGPKGSGPWGVDGRPINANSIWYPKSMGADDIITDIMQVSINAADVTAPLASQQSFVNFGEVEICPAPGIGDPGWEIQQNTSIGQALQDLVASGVVDLIFRPIFDQIGFPGVLCEIDVRSAKAPANGAGRFNYEAIFAWDMPSHSLVGISDLFDGTARANSVQYSYGVGGPSLPVQKNAESIARYGEYWSQQTYPEQGADVAVLGLAQYQLYLRKFYKQTLTVNPAPERSPEPLIDYKLGDRVPVYASNNLRQPLPATLTTNANGVNALNSASIKVGSTSGFPTSGSFLLLGVSVNYTGKTAAHFTGCSAHPATVGGELILATHVLAWQRIYGIPISIDDNGVETVRELLVGPVGGPPPVVSTNQINYQQAVISGQRLGTARVGSVQAPRNG